MAVHPCPICGRPAETFWLTDRAAWAYRCGRCGPIRAAPSLLNDLEARRRRGDHALLRLLRALAAAVPQLPPDVVLTAENWEAEAREYLEEV